MKKLYLSVNYLIAFQDGLENPFGLSSTFYDETTLNFQFVDKVNRGRIIIAKTDVGDWFDETGLVPFTEATLRTFLQTNTGNFKTASGGSGAKLLRTAQEISYRTGDDGDIQQGRDVSFLELEKKNPFGNNHRFTDELGGQNYVKDIVIDWSTYDGVDVFGIHRIPFALDNWNNSIDACLAHSVPGFLTDWRMPNRRELDNISDYETPSSGVRDYSPINNTSNLWTSTTYKQNTPQAYYNSPSGVISIFGKQNSLPFMAVRSFVVIGTVLT